MDEVLGASQGRLVELVAREAFAAWVNHPDAAFVETAWAGCSDHTKACWQRVADRIAAFVMGPTGDVADRRTRCSP